MTIFFSVGEPSGDLHGANLIRELSSRRANLRFVGYGGPRMAAAGCELHEDLTKHAIMWLLQVFLALPTFISYMRRAGRYFRDAKPDAVVLIDYPGFNWWIARQAKRYGIPVFYYGTPQLWGWASWRVKKMKRLVDHVLCKLPFEPKWYADRGCQATYVGHPYFDELATRVLDRQFVTEQASKPGPLVTILPGSRTQEVKSNFARQLISAELIRQRVPNVRFAVASFKASQGELAKEEIAKHPGLPIEVHVGRTPELIEAATCCIAVSGSVSLELLYHHKPTVIVYHVSKFGYWVQGFFRRVRYITLVNLLTTPELLPKEVGVYDRRDPRDSHVLMPEYMACEDRTVEVASHIVEWLQNEPQRQKLVAHLARLSQEVGQGGASRKAAEYMLKRLPQSVTKRDAA